MTQFSTCFSWGRGLNKPRNCTGLMQLQTFPFALKGQRLRAKAQAWGHTSMGLLVFLPHLCLVASPPKSLMNKGTLPWYCLASG